jgi:Amt family ammonium transporter
VIAWSAVVTFILMKLIGLLLRGARYSDDILEIGDLAIHDEEAFPEEKFAERVGGGGGGAFALAGLDVGTVSPPNEDLG